MRIPYNKQYDGRKLAILIVPSHTTSKRGWLEKFLNNVPSHSDKLFKIVTSEQDLKEKIRKANTHIKSVYFVNNPIAQNEYSHVLKVIRDKGRNIEVMGLHLFRHRKKLCLFDTQLKQWNDKVKQYLSK